jgi:hypothetical protein
MEDINPTLPNKDTHPVLLMFGAIAILSAALFAARITWEETLLTIAQGPQMVGFAIAHIFPVAFLAPLALAFWLVIAVIVMITSLIRRRTLSKMFWATLAAAVVVLGVLSIPEELWQWTFIGSFSKSAHAADLMSTDAAEGYTRTVRGYLDHGVAVNARNYDGSTAAHAAAVGGQLEVLQLLVSRGADLNAVNSYGDSPLAEAIDMKHASAAAYLAAHGARDIRPVKVIPPADTTVTVDGGK